MRHIAELFLQRLDGSGILSPDPRIVYRIQDTFGAGPLWRMHPLQGSNLRLLGYKGCHLWSPPLTPALISRIRPDEYVGYGCLTIKDLAGWFDGAVGQHFQKQGYRPVMMMADRILSMRKRGPERGNMREVMFTRRLPFTVAFEPLKWESFETLANM